MAVERDLFGADLFGEPIMPASRGRTRRSLAGHASAPAGLRSWDEIIPASLEAELIARINACELTPFRFQGWQGKRLTCSFGMHYDFEKGEVAQAEPMPDWLAFVRDAVAACTGLPSELFIQALLIRYDPGAGIGWHRYRPVFEHIAGLSLGNPATLRFRRRRDDGFDRYGHLARPRSAYHMSGEARYAWEHSIDDMAVPRWSITFRTLSRTSGVRISGAASFLARSET